MSARRAARLLLAGCSLALAACAASSPVKTADARNVWYAVTPATAAPAPLAVVAVNLHPAGAEVAGRVRLANGAVYPVFNVARTDTTLSFMATALDMTTQLDAAFTGTRDGAGWSGRWINHGETQTLSLKPGSAPDEHGLQMVALPDGRQMHLVCLGEGSPTVVFDAGAGGTVDDWRKVHAEIAKTTRACAYDRAGMGLSDEGPAPRDAAAVSRDMGAMLKAAGIKAPYVLVGHSLGSYHVRQFANTHARDVVGMVLVDPSGDFQVDRFASASPHLAQITNPEAQVHTLKDCAARARKGLTPHGSAEFRSCGGNTVARFETLASEIESMTTQSSPELAKSRRSYGDMPLIVLTRGDFAKGMPAEATPEDTAAFQATWRQMHEEMRALSSLGERREIAGSGHYVQLDQPAAVIGAVNEVVATARKAASR
jgi:pimeloyl-ACP methyl ester carboxylesterase